MKQDDYYAARKEHAWLLRAEGAVFREIAARLGVNKESARQLTLWFGRRMRKATSKMKMRIIHDG
jgi:hypothetical protein